MRVTRDTRKQFKESPREDREKNKQNICSFSSAFHYLGLSRERKTLPPPPDLFLDEHFRSGTTIILLVQEKHAHAHRTLRGQSRLQGGAALGKQLPRNFRQQAGAVTRPAVSWQRSTPTKKKQSKEPHTPKGYAHGPRLATWH